jgi:hypothetical protein
MLYRYLSTKVRLFGITWDIATINALDTKVSIWTLMFMTLIQTCAMIAIPVLYIAVGVCMLTPLCVVVGLSAGFVLLPNSVGLFIVTGVIIPCLFTFIFTNAAADEIQKSYLRYLFRWITKLWWASKVLIPFVALFMLVIRVCTTIANPIEIEIEEEKDD